MLFHYEAVITLSGILLHYQAIITLTGDYYINACNIPGNDQINPETLPAGEDTTSKTLAKLYIK